MASIKTPHDAVGGLPTGLKPSRSLMPHELFPWPLVRTAMWQAVRTSGQGKSSCGIRLRDGFSPVGRPPTAS